MRFFVILSFITVFLTSCAGLQKPKTLEEVKATLDCIEYKNGMDWEGISKSLGDPDIIPIPEPGRDLSRNARGYEDKIILFHTERREIEQGDKVRFKEVITGVELCKKK